MKSALTCSLVFLAACSYSPAATAGPVPQNGIGWSRLVMPCPVAEFFPGMSGYNNTSQGNTVVCKDGTVYVQQ